MPTSKDTSDQKMMQGAMIFAFATMAVRVQQQIKKQVREGKSAAIDHRWYFMETLRIMKDVFRVEIERDTPEYELVKNISALQCDTIDATRRIMDDVTQDKPMTRERLAELQAKFGIG